MNELTNFAERDFVEQVTILGEIEKQTKVEAIPALAALHVAQAGNQAVSHMIRQTLRTLLTNSETETVKALSSDDAVLVPLAIEVAKEKQFPSAVPHLIQLTRTEQDGGQLVRVLAALSTVESAETLDIFRRFIQHGDDVVAAHSIVTLGQYRDAGALPALCDIVKAGEADERYEQCSVMTEAAIRSIGAIGGEEAVKFLAAMIHHRNPTARAFIHETLINIGEEAVAHIAPLFDTGDTDQRILAANVLMRIGGKTAGNTLINALDKGAAKHANIRFAIYEALGHIPSMKSIVCLVDAISETDEMVLLAVVIALDKQVNPGVITKLRDAITADAAHGVRLANAITGAKAFNLIDALYHCDATIGQMLVDAIAAQRDTDAIAAMIERLTASEQSSAKAHIDTLKALEATASAKTVLAVDDSEAMLYFYRGLASTLNLHIETAADGKQALEVLQALTQIDLIITDMNMPNMDGIEFTRQVREEAKWESLPIIMATTESESSQTQLAAKAGVNAFIKKPFTKETLAEQIQKLL